MGLVIYENLTSEDIILNKNFYAEELVKNKLVGFKKLNPTIEEHEQIVLNVSIVNEKNENINDKEFYWVTNHAHRDLYQPNKLSLNKDIVESFKKWCMHVDVTPVIDQSNNLLDNNPHTAFVSMHMTTFNCDNSFGKTLLLDLTNLYKKCPQEFKDKLTGQYLEHHIATAEEFGIDTPAKSKVEMNKYELGGLAAEMELVVEQAKIKNLFSIFYPFRTHPVTKETILFWPSYSSVQPHNKSILWFDELKSWIKDYLDDESNWYEWTWDQGDVIIFDNRCMLHTFTPGWKSNERVFNQIILGFENPFYDAYAEK